MHKLRWQLKSSLSAQVTSGSATTERDVVISLQVCAYLLLSTSASWAGSMHGLRGT
ncbi:hypothetical protein LS482_11680 [Sinomicrobium kalidii]|uniref:hypothetical protein n=1 Tax=Sinomicrobium kalidii TaxID=2900738 RepID=UPI001E58178F|nr:hypothetical protein [Sinomicrobium kalidii]UGU14368.1 hypothetical protein LS482_11680 [Sinomicrobium kalidii]